MGFVERNIFFYIYCGLFCFILHAESVPQWFQQKYVPKLPRYNGQFNQYTDYNTPFDNGHVVKNNLKKVDFTDYEIEDEKMYSPRKDNGGMVSTMQKNENLVSDTKPLQNKDSIWAYNPEKNNHRNKNDEQEFDVQIENSKINTALEEKIKPTVTKEIKQNNIKPEVTLSQKSLKDENLNKKSIEKLNPQKKEEKSTSQITAQDLKDLAITLKDFPAIIPTCDGATFCTNVTNYPHKVLEKALRNKKNLELYNNDDVDSKVDIRIDGIDNDTPLCTSTESVVFPQTAESLENEWMFIVNYKNITQGIRVEICQEEKSPCNVVEGSIPGYFSFCKQRYVFRTLAALTRTGQIESHIFRFPASCCCHVSLSLNSLSRIGNIFGDDDDTKKTPTIPLTNKTIT